MKKTRDIIETLFICPLCEERMYISDNGKSAYCRGERKHCFDFSSDGYLGLSLCGGGDSKEAVRARRSFLSKGYYDKAAEDIRTAVSEHVSECGVLVDAGCGEGFYTGRLSQDADMTVGFDLSKFACAAAAKDARRSGMDGTLYSTASIFALPLAESSADCIVNIFAPCAEDEFSRVLKPGGILIVAGAGEKHLLGLKRVLYDNIYLNGERADMPTKMVLVDKRVSTFDICVDSREDIAALFSMTPYYWRTSEADKKKLDGREKLETEIEFEIRIYRNEK